MARITDPLTGETKDKGITDLTTGPEDYQNVPLVSASAYSKRVEAKRKAVEAAKSRNVPVGHAPPIPEGKLQPVVDALRTLPQPDWGAPPPKVQEPTKQELEEWAPPPKVQGMGAAYAVNQAMAQGKFDRPMSLKEANQMVKEQAAQVEQVVQEDSPDVEEEKESVKEKLATAEKQIAESALDFFDVAAYQQAQIPLLRPSRKKAIEGRLKALDFEDLITKREIHQEIPVIPGQFSVGLRTVREKEHLWILQYLYEKTGVSSPAHVDELNSVCRLTCAVLSINGRPLPEHRDNIGQPGESIVREKFEKKLEIILGFPTQIVADLGVQFNWFSDRVTRLFSVDELKNG